ncbi:aminotransferase class I/II-fold pyridoxal phosphate-dependent enzyme [Streptomyces omiyaensis]|uniref:aminotransferase class I/II-fold pyridoxal phosphate-dependent enzyme n=1 Tax=Streptomyces omiyaensis TaxID=68247 RepID=UPI00167614D3|nr:PLP-dependent aminotransferase family protein [Streptomyces omiyaensis]
MPPAAAVSPPATPPAAPAPPPAARPANVAPSPVREIPALTARPEVILLVTTGSQQALTLLATALLEPGDVVLVEDPCSLAALQAFGFAGARAVPVPTDDDGILPEALDEIAARERPTLLYVVPTFQNPTGRTLPAARRAAVAEAAARHGFWIAEDDPYGELRFEGEPVPNIAGLPAALPEGSRWNRPEGGMFVWATLPGGRDAGALLATAIGHDVAYVPGAPFYAGTPDPASLRLSFTTHAPDEIAEGLRRLAEAFA